MYEHIELRPNDSGFGAEIRGVNLADPLPPAVVDEIKQAWYRYSVVYFPDQPLTLEQLEAYTRSIGEFGYDPYIEPLRDHPHVLEIRREAEEKAQNFGAAWHSDWSFQECPPSATILHAQEVPAVGGDTLYADCYRAFEALSAAMQEFLSSLQVVHSAGRAYSPTGFLAEEKNPRSMQIRFTEEAENTQLHPLVRTHPGSGRRALYVNPVYTVCIKDLSEGESQVLLSYLYKLITREEFVYHHQWQTDMLTMWDNRCCNHFAEGGYDGYLRVMHRTTVAGERPTAGES